MKMKKVMTPWGVGFSECEDTYCCELQPSWFVEFPDDPEGEGHYFGTKDCTIIEEAVSIRKPSR
jgi:hypothetical protein